MYLFVSRRQPRIIRTCPPGGRWVRVYHFYCKFPANVKAAEHSRLDAPPLIVFLALPLLPLLKPLALSHSRKPLVSPEEGLRPKRPLHEMGASWPLGFPPAIHLEKENPLCRYSASEGVYSSSKSRETALDTLQKRAAWQTAYSGSHTGFFSADTSRTAAKIFWLLPSGGFTERNRLSPVLRNQRTVLVIIRCVGKLSNCLLALLRLPGPF